MSGLLASDLPEPIAMARKRLAGVAERRAGSGRLGFGLLPRDTPAPRTDEAADPVAPAEDAGPAEIRGRRPGDPLDTGHPGDPGRSVEPRT